MAGTTQKLRKDEKDGPEQQNARCPERADQRGVATINTQTEVHSIKLNQQDLRGVVTNRGEIKKMKSPFTC